MLESPPTMHRLLPLLLACLLAAPAAQAQKPDTNDRAAERIALLSDDVRAMANDARTDRARKHLNSVRRMLDGALAELSRGDRRDAQDLLDESAELLEEVIDDLRRNGYDGRADRVERLRRRILAEQLTTARGPSGSLQEGRYVNGRRVDRDERARRERADRIADRAERRADRIADRIEERADDWAESWEDRWHRNWDNDRKREWRSQRSRFRSYAPAFVGDFGYRWPYAETSTYRPIPSIRYNRVDGLTIGIRRPPMDWDSYDRARVFGQVGYSFGLDEWRYEAGAEARLGQPYSYNDFDVKVGGAYRRETTTNDLWKASWAENSAAAFLFKTDFFDYFQTEGYTLYSVARLTPALQATIAYRSDDYTSLRRNASWSLFGGDDFRFNPGVREGRMQSMVLAIDGGQIRGLRWIPSGVAFRAEAELGDGLGGDFAFNRYQGDVRAYLRPSRDTGLALRVRGATSDGDVPVQKRFTLGGAGSLRAYPQNAFRGSRMLLANAEVTLYDVRLLDDIFDQMALFGLFDAGWVNGPQDASFDLKDAITSAGFGVAIADRQVRLELAWPLRDLGTGMEPTLWLRLNPTF